MESRTTNENTLQALREKEKVLHQLVRERPTEYLPVWTAALIELGKLLYQNHDFPSCEQTWKQVLDIFQKNPKANRADLASTYNNLGTIYGKQRKYCESEDCFLNALYYYRNLFKEAEGTYRAYLAMTLSNLGELYSYQREHTKSESYYREALTHYKVLSQGHPEVYKADEEAIQNSLDSLHREMEEQKGSEKSAQTGQGTQVKEEKGQPGSNSQATGDDTPPQQPLADWLARYGEELKRRKDEALQILSEAEASKPKKKGRQ
ncbi:MAG: tetratricopeptide repeat protein [Bacteroidales bacterium]|nr:tetratricopeptide repeat protein [Bacteroidales bacterium]